MTRFLDTLPGDVSPGSREKQRPGATPRRGQKGNTPAKFSRKKCEPVREGPAAETAEDPAGWVA
ncbi:MAG: hypothetical protein K0S82_639 [Gaiellaceae bacterium]|nr:hypothetical protein [Gaiellaceae bacterium]